MKMWRNVGRIAPRNTDREVLLWRKSGSKGPINILLGPLEPVEHLGDYAGKVSNGLSKQPPLVRTLRRRTGPMRRPDHPLWEFRRSVAVGFAELRSREAGCVAEVSSREMCAA